MNLSESIRLSLDRKRDSYISFLQKTIQEPSTTTNELGVQKLVEKKLKSLGLEVDMWEPNYETLSKNKFFNSTRTSFKDSPNVVGVMKGTGGGNSIILNGHIDVVPPGELAPWTDDPYSGKVEGGKVYGRGATDMKGGNLTLLMAIETILDLGIKLKGDVVFQSVIEEESGGSGTLAAIERGYKADVALIPEPSQMKIVPKQQGSVWFRIKVEGISAHGGTRYEGVSAIDKAILVYQEILALEKRRNDRVTDPLYANNPIPLPINIGKFNSGYFPSAVPDKTELEGRYGISPGETIEDAQLEFEDTLKSLSKKDSWFKEHPVEIEWFGLKLPPGECNIDHPFLSTLNKSYRKIKDEEPELIGSTWGTDGGLLTQAGGIPSVIFGPGTTKMAHFANEYVEIDLIFETAEIITHAIIDWCEISKDGVEE